MTEVKRPVDQPPVPRAHGRVMFWIASVICVVIVAGYGMLAYSQRELGHEERDAIPSGMRSTPGGYRSYSYWHSGYHGGK